MDTRTRTSSPMATNADPTVAESHPPPPTPQDNKISAYYSLVFPHFTFYIQTLSITIGRRCNPNPNAASSSTGDQQTVDVDLGALKSVSRLHAKIEYDQEEDRFVLAVVGRNGAWVDGVWAAAGTRAPLSERSLVQIASRTFHFVLPPPPPPEDSPSPSSQSSANRRRSPSVEPDIDITSISPPSSQPSHSPILDIKPLPPSPEPPARPKLKIEPPPELPNSNNIGKSGKTNAKKRKKGEPEPAPIVVRPKPEDIPPKPPFTYAQLIYRAIKDIGGKATLQEICNWIANKHEYYRWADGAWMSSVRHNLSSGRAFLKMERCGGDRGKGFFWSVDEKYSQQLEEQESKVQQAAQAAAAGVVKEHKPGRKKDKNGVLEPPLKRSIKGDLKGTPLPPPLTSAPLPFKTITASNSQPSSSTATGPGATTGVFAYPTHPQQLIPNTSLQLSTTTPVPNTPNPYASLTQWNVHPTASSTTLSAAALSSSTFLPGLTTTSPPSPSLPISVPSSHPQSISPATQPAALAPPGQSLVPDVHIPIILGPIPTTHPDYSPGHPNNSVKQGYMVLHERKLILDPDVFSGLTRENLAELEKMGARGALVVLTGHMVKALKERRAKAKNKDKVSRRPKGAKKNGAPTTAPFTNTPLERRTSVPISGPVPAAVPLTSAADANPPPFMGSLPLLLPPPPQPIESTPDARLRDPGSPIINIEDSDDEAPASKRRKLDDGTAISASIPVA